MPSFEEMLMFKFTKPIALIIFEILYWFFPNIFSSIFGFQQSILFAVVILGCLVLGFLAGKTFFKEETIEKNLTLLVWVFLIYFFTQGIIFTLISFFNLNIFESGFSLPAFLPLIVLAWFLFQIFNGFNVLLITPFLIGFYLQKAMQKN